MCYVMAYGMYGMVWRYVWHGIAWHAMGMAILYI